MISKNLRKHFSTLKMIAQMPPNARKAVLKHKSDDNSFYKALREIAKNTTKKHVPLASHHKKKLKKEKNLIVALAKKGNKRIKRRKLVMQTGKGFFLPVVIPIIASLIGELINKNNE